MKYTLLFTFFLLSISISSQEQQILYNIIDSVSVERIKSDIKTLVDFGTRNTFSDTISNTRGIGAARRWIKQEFETISNNCLEVFYQKDFVTKEGNSRVPHDAWVVNVVAIQRGTKYSDRYIIMSGDIDSRGSDTMDFITDAPGANDNASGMAEEQGLFGGAGLAKFAQENQWDIIGVFNNDMIGNIEGVDGVIDNRTFRIFSEPVPPTETERERQMRRYYGGEVDGISRQLARYVYSTTKKYMPEMNPMMVYRLDRFGRGGHHKPFNDLGFAAIRIMEAHENYTQQHQDVRVENGIAYGDTFEHVNFEYAKKLTAVNAINMASLASAPPRPDNVAIGGIVEASAKLKWDAVEGAIGYKIYWRDTTSPAWDYSRFVGNITEYTLNGIVIDNYYFGVVSVGKNGFESPVTFPNSIIRN